MEFSQVQLESMSDFELNVVAANHFYDYVCITTSPSRLGVDVRVDDVCVDDSYNPCDRWADCGDLIDELINGTPNDIELDDTILRFFVPDDEICIKHGNVKRAVTIAYILVKQSQK